ncbi:MAG: tetraacyldisaccharide 4'-kinase, partial [Rhodospirillales bacterium]|nr:tetraacyldisaccharide 4'-kinase [Rhodospirillales bacterium]
MKAPEFWYGEGGGLRSFLLAPAGWVYGAAGRLRFAFSSPWRASVPVICVGNLVTGGAGKTPVALSIGQRLADQGREVHFLTRGHGGALKGPVKAEPGKHTVDEVGDEALLLARLAPTWVAGARPAGARAAIAGGAEVLVMDDGFQNPALFKDLSLIVIDGPAGLGNGRLIPAGPLREGLAVGLGRAQAVVMMGSDDRGMEDRMAGRGPQLLRASLQADGASERLAGRRVVGFAGIGRPAKFFATLGEIGCQVMECHEFSDHYRYDQRDLDHLAGRAAVLDAVLVTTAKDGVRLPPKAR